jgi:hypothetical protein
VEVDQATDPARGNKRTVDEREVVNGLMYILSTGAVGVKFWRSAVALAVDDCRHRAGVLPGQLPVLHVERMVNAIECAVMVPSAEVIIHGAARRQVLQ